MTWDTEWTIHKMRDALNASDEAVRRALVVLYRQQTSEERAEAKTVERNSLGFNTYDAAFGTSLAEKVLRGEKLGKERTEAARKMLMKYASQLTSLHNAGVRANLPRERSHDNGRGR
jgi:mannitol-1-phosphate/altronate dehydrogenase